MNKEYTVQPAFHSDNGIYDAFYAEIRKPRLAFQDAARARLVRLLHALLAALFSKTVRRMARVCLTIAGLLGAVGAAGALEAGRLSPLACLLTAGVCLLLTYLAIRPRTHKSNTN